ncbi:cystathionine beta-lyase [Rarobacter incanus]|uniref:cysteine-S-conjugate beta-lyase n=1 Tax=Rarobacter incanus TaxID=153494 RepID=A0A542SQ41_9MICO|nr:cystathionine beta-lyase [Rarobacter incanus]
MPLRLLRQRTSVKWSTYGPDVLPLWVAEMDCDLAEPIVGAVTRAVQRGDTGYWAGKHLRDAFGEVAAARWGWDVGALSSVAVPNVMSGVVACLDAVVEPGTPVLVASPVYPPLAQYPRQAGYPVHRVALTAAGRLDLAALAEAFGHLPSRGAAPRGAFLLCNPHNPTGVVHTRAELEELGRIARECAVVVIADEIHALVSYEPFTPALSAIREAYALHSASKAFNLVGMNIALLWSADPVPISPAIAHGDQISAIAHTAALRECGPWLDQALSALTNRRRLLTDFIRREAPIIGFAPPQATYLAWLDLAAASGARGERISATVLRERAGLALTSGTAFGSANHVRLNFATSPAILLSALERLASVVA